VDAENAHLAVTLSMGAVQIEEGVSLDALLVRAGNALYEAKRQGRSRLIVWEPAAGDDTRDAA
jgi:PleD family two-component response regulator